MKLVSLFQTDGRTGGSPWSWSLCFKQTVGLEVHSEAILSVGSLWSQMDTFPFSHYNQKRSHCNKNISRYNGKPPLVTGLISCSQRAEQTGTMGVVALTLWVGLFVCMCVCMFVCMYVCLYACILCVFVCLHVLSTISSEASPAAVSLCIDRRNTRITHMTAVDIKTEQMHPRLCIKDMATGRCWGVLPRQQRGYDARRGVRQADTIIPLQGHREVTYQTALRLVLLQSLMSSPKETLLFMQWKKKNPPRENSKLRFLLLIAIKKASCFEHWVDF